MSSPFDGPLDRPIGESRPTVRLSPSWASPPTTPSPQLTIETSLRPEFGHVHPAASLSVCFMRTPRVPGQHRGWPMHGALGRLPFARVSELGRAVPYNWHEAGGVVVPMYRSEAAWLRFRSPTGYPFAVKVIAGATNAISGERWRAGLAMDPPNHLVVPAQGWLDGVRLGDRRVRQFAPDDAEARDGEPCGARLQLVVTPMKGDEWARRTARPTWPCAFVDDDLWGPDVWDESASQTCIVRMVPASCWSRISDQPVPHAPLGWHVFERSGLPWSDGFEEDGEVLHSGVELIP